MMPDDRYQRAFDQTVGDIRSWIKQHKDHADITEEDAPSFWRVAIRPDVASACPAELILYRGQRYDITIGAETYTGRPMDNPGLFVKLLDAIAQGWVVTRRYASAATGQLVAVDTIVTLAHGAKWTDRRELSVLATRDIALERRDQHYVPFTLG